MAARLARPGSARLPHARRGPRLHRSPEALTSQGGAGLDAVGHQDRVEVLLVSRVVALSKPLFLEAERLVEGDRGLVPGEDVELELERARDARPADGFF